MAHASAAGRPQDVAVRVRAHVSLHSQQAFAVHQRNVRREEINQFRIPWDLGQTQDEGMKHICLVKIAVDHVDHFFTAQMTDEIGGITAADHYNRRAACTAQGLHRIFDHRGTVQRQQRLHYVMTQAHSGRGDDSTSRTHKVPFAALPTRSLR